MKVLQGILSESRDYYLQTQKKIIRLLERLPKGNIKRRKINSKYYYYLQERVKDKIRHKYLGRENPKELSEQLSQRRLLRKELRTVNQAMKILKRVRGHKND